VATFLSNRDAGVGMSKYLDQPMRVLDQVANKPLIFFDTETTGLHQYRNQITEIAAVYMYGMEELGSFHRRIELSGDTAQLKDMQEKAVQMAVQGKSPLEIRQETSLPPDKRNCQEKR
jgi:DNA polymerase III alpha subunit (gram-positive type)